MIREEFAVHMLNDAGKSKAHSLAEAFSSLLDTIEGMLPASRELSLVKTHLQEASFFAKRGMAMNPSNQE